MLTIDEIKNISFRKANLTNGYRAEDVDSFIDEVIVSFEQLKKRKKLTLYIRLMFLLQELNSTEQMRKL